MKKFFTVVAMMLFPLAVFRWGMWGLIENTYHTGETLHALALLLASIVFIALWEGLAFRAWILPLFGRAVSHSVYGGNYSADDDPLVVLSKNIRHMKDASLLPELEACVRQDAARARGWTELADIHLSVFHSSREAVRVLEQGAAYARPEDAAMLLYRAAGILDTRLHDSAGAAEMYRTAARRYPATIYGRKAAAKA